MYRSPQTLPSTCPGCARESLGSEVASETQTLLARVTGAREGLGNSLTNGGSFVANKPISDEPR